MAHHEIQRVIQGFAAKQTVNQQVGSVHGAALCNTHGDILCLREDIGRHNALDKLRGAMLLLNDATSDVIAVSSRASYEMVTKAILMGAQILIAVSAPTSLAVDIATTAGLTLVGYARDARHTIYTHKYRITD